MRWMRWWRRHCCLWQRCCAEVSPLTFATSPYYIRRSSGLTWGTRGISAFGLMYRLCPTRERMHKALVLECSERARGQMGKHSNDGRCA